MTAHEETCRKSTAVAGLAREVEDLRRRMDATASADDVVRLAEVVTDLEAALNKPKPDTDAPPTWLGLAQSADDAEDLLDELTTWLGDVYLRYVDAAKGLPECWLWHPEVVEELLWLMRAWEDAYGEAGSSRAAGDWHDRLRPGVVRRIRETYAASCSLENHLPDRAIGVAMVPTADAADDIVAWWTTDRDQPGPAPTDEQLAAAADALRRARRGGTTV